MVTLACTAFTNTSSVGVVKKAETEIAFRPTSAKVVENTFPEDVETAYATNFKKISHLLTLKGFVSTVQPPTWPIVLLYCICHHFVTWTCFVG